MIETHANANKISHVDVCGTQQARRVAAALPRDAAAVDRLSPGANGTVEIWLDLAADTEIAAFEPPAGWALVEISVQPDTNGVCVTLTEECDR